MLSPQEAHELYIGLSPKAPWIHLVTCSMRQVVHLQEIGPSKWDRTAKRRWMWSLFEEVLPITNFWRAHLALFNSLCFTNLLLPRQEQFGHIELNRLFLSQIRVSHVGRVKTDRFGIGGENTPGVRTLRRLPLLFWLLLVTIRGS